MAASVNKVMMLGTLTRDPELKYLPSGTPVGQIGLALNRVWFDKNTREKHEEVTFVDVTVFAKTAENAHQYLKKGRQCFVEGYLKLDQWDDKNTGQKRSKLKVVCERLTFVGGQPQGQQGGAPQQRPVSNAKPPQRPVSNAKPPQAAQEPPDDWGLQEDEIPF